VSGNVVVANTMEEAWDRPSAPFDIQAHFAQHIPEIEQRIRALKPHVIVCGLGPSAWLLPKVDQSLLDGVRIWGVNDFWKIAPCHDLTVMDGPQGELHPSRDRHQWIVKAAPQRWWFFHSAWPGWKPKLPHAHESGRVTKFELTLWMPDKKPGMETVPMLQGRPYHHTMMSPIGSVAIAWGEGCRRIGILGMDLLPDHHRLSAHAKWVSWFLSQFAHQAGKLDGRIANLSPFSKLKLYDPEAKTA
jgi:hypothetical protein